LKGFSQKKSTQEKMLDSFLSLLSKKDAVFLFLPHDRFLPFPSSVLPTNVPPPPRRFVFIAPSIYNFLSIGFQKISLN
jgi:hypothetical protein